MIPQEIICRKRDGEALNARDIRAFVNGIAAESVSDEQIAALTMAVWFRGLSVEEQGHLTLAIRDSGATLQWQDLSGPVVDKHSTGGVGDMVSFAAGPIVAACGGFVPMISGRGLGHTGGTLDKLESFPGINVTPDIPTLKQWVRQRGLAIVGQTAELAPADRRIYAIRDATATVDSRPLIVSSILGKKLCEGLDALVMDVKVGNGATLTQPDASFQLAEEICKVAESAGLTCSAILTDMNQPLSRSAGNALEIREILGYLSGDRREPRFHRVTVAISAEMLRLGGLARDTEEGTLMVERVLATGAPAEVFASMIAGQGGPRVPFEQLASQLPSASITRPVFAAESGTVTAIDTRSVGLAVVALGGGRRKAGEQIDHSVGLTEIAGIGEEVDSARPLAVVHAEDESAWQDASERICDAYMIGEGSPNDAGPVILGRRGAS